MNQGQRTIQSFVLDFEKMEISPKNALPAHERTTAILLILLFLFASALNIYRDRSDAPPVDPGTHIAEPYIEITITGAVKKPGTYQVPKGTPTIEAIRQAEPFDNANLKKITEQSKITRRRTIDIKELQKK